MSYSKNVLGLKVLDSVSFIEKGTALTIELFKNEACIRPATSNDTVVGIALEDYTRGVDNLNGDRISVSIIEFSPGIAGVNIQAGNLLSVNDSGKFIESSKNVIGVAITNGKLGGLFQFVRVFSKEGSGSSGGVSSVNGMTGDVVIDASKIDSVISHGTQAQFNEGVQKSFDYVSEELPKKQSKLVANESIEIVDNKINDKVIEGLKVVLTNPTDGRVSMTGSAKVVGRLLYLYARLDGAPQTFNQISLQINDVPDYVFLVENNSVILGKENGGSILNCNASRDTDKTKVNFNIVSKSGLMVNGGVSIAHTI